MTNDIQTVLQSLRSSEPSSQEQLKQALEGMDRLDLSKKAIRAIDSQGALLSDEQVQKLSSAISENTTIKELDLSGNRINEAGAVALSETLRENKTLETLKLNATKIKKNGMRAIGNALKENDTLEELELKRFTSKNYEGSLHADAVIEAMETNTSLRRLDMDFSSIGDKAANKLVTVMERNTSLDEVVLNGTEYLKQVESIRQSTADNKNNKIRFISAVK